MNKELIVFIVPIVTAAISFFAGWIVRARTREKCPDVKLGGMIFDGCDFRLVEEWKNVSVEVCRCRRCGAVDVSWYRQSDSVCVYKEEEEDETE